MAAGRWLCAGGGKRSQKRPLGASTRCAPRACSRACRSPFGSWGCLKCLWRGACASARACYFVSISCSASRCVWSGAHSCYKCTRLTGHHDASVLGKAIRRATDRLCARGAACVPLLAHRLQVGTQEGDCPTERAVSFSSLTSGGSLDSLSGSFRRASQVHHSLSQAIR